MVELDIPKGMGLIVRTAGAQRPKPEVPPGPGTVEKKDPFGPSD